MIDYLPSAADVLAVRVREGLARDELNTLMERLQGMIDRNAETHVFVDIDRLRPEDWRNAFETLPHSMKLFRLDRYGRVAIVSDDRLVRGWSRLESAMLPRVHYEIFHSEEADRAFQWVEGKVAVPHVAALKFLETNNPLVLAYAIDGTLTTADMDRAIETVRPRLARELGPVSVLARVGELLFSDPVSLFDERYFRFKKDALARVERYAIVGGPAWLRLMVKATVPFVPFDLRYFEKDDEKAAWDWIGAKEARTESDAPASKAEALA